MFQLINSFEYQLEGEVMKTVFKHKKVNHVALRISKGMKKQYVISIFIAPGVETLIRK